MKISSTITQLNLKPAADDKDKIDLTIMLSGMVTKDEFIELHQYFIKREIIDVIEWDNERPTWAGNVILKTKDK